MVFTALISPYNFVASLYTGVDISRQQDLMRKLADYVDRDYAGGIKTLLSNQADIDLIAAGIKQSPHSPLHEAVERRMDRALQVLMEKLPAGVWHVRSEMTGRTPFMLAAANGHSQFIRDLHRRLISATSEREILPLDKRADALRALKAEFECELEEGDPFECIWWSVNNARDHDGNTAVLLAMKHQKYECCFTLLFWRANAETQNKAGESVKSLGVDLPKDSDLYWILYGRHEKPQKTQCQIL